MDQNERDERIAILREWRRQARQAESALYRIGLEMEAEIADLEGDATRAAWNRALASGAPEAERHRLYVRLQAESVLEGGESYLGIPMQERDEIAAEVERLRAEQQQVAPPSA